MWLKIACVVVMACGALARTDELLEPLYGRGQRNRLALCVAGGGRWRRCDAALYARGAAVARARCLAAAPPARLAAERPAAGGDCSRVAAGSTGVYRSRSVRRRVLHPWLDLAIVILDTPYNDLDQLANATEIRLKLRRHGVYKWMKSYFEIYALTRSHQYHQNRIARNSKTFHYPFWYFFITMVLPSVLFILFFIYITFYTGQPPAVPYKKKRYSKKVTYV